MKQMNNARIHILAKGNVQGVFFRVNAKQKADELNIFGWVRNLDSDKVEIVAEGNRDKLEKLVEWCEQGSSAAEVEDMRINWQDYFGEFNNFEIKY